MKKIYSVVFALFVGASASWAQLQNLGLEDWSSGGTYETPDGWFDINGLVTQIQVDPVLEKVSVDPAQGQFAAAMTTRYCALCGFAGIPIDTIPGVLRQEQSVVGKPVSMSFKYKFAPVDGDYAGAQIELTKWDAMLDTAEVLGEGFLEITAASGTWVDATVWVDYTSSDMPDSVKITFLTSPRILTQDESYPFAKLGTQLIVDDISVSTPVSVDELTDGTLRVFMANDVLNIIADDFLGNDFQVITLNGQVIHQGTLMSSTTYLPIADLSNGLYFVRMRSEKGMVTAKFVK